MRQTPVPESKLNEQDLTKLWKDNIAGIIKEENQAIIEEFIHHLFNPDEEYKRWKMAAIHIPLAKNLIEAVIQELAKIKDDDGIVSSNINAICKGFKYHPDRQIGEMMLVYHILIGEVDSTSSIEDFTRYLVAQEKTRAFEMAITPTTATQNIHVLNFWKHELRDEVGFDFEFQTKIGTMGQDIFNGYHGNALRAFYDFFTPEYAIDRLTMKINDNNDTFYEGLGMISGGIDKNKQHLMYLIDADRVAHHKALELAKLIDDEGFRSETRERKYEQRIGIELFDQVLNQLRAEAENDSNETLYRKTLELRAMIQYDLDSTRTWSLMRLFEWIFGWNARELFERALEQYNREKFIIPEGKKAIVFAGSVTPEFTRYLLVKMGIIRETN